MARFRDSIPQGPEALAHNGQATATDAGSGAGPDRSIGEIIRDLRSLTPEQVEKILAYQRDKGVRFGEAAIALKLASDQDVLFALSQQYHYPFAGEGKRNLSSEVVIAHKPFSRNAEAFRAIRSQLMMRVYGVEGPRMALAVVSPDSGDGKSYFAANLAVALAQLGTRTLLIDADLRGPRQHQLFGMSNNAGLSGILSGRSEGSVIQQVADVPSLFVLPVGAVPPNPSELIERPAFGLLMRELLSKFEFVVVDTPAGVHGSDANVIAARCGAAIAIARKDKTKVKDLQDFVSVLCEAPLRLAGVVLNEF